MQHRWLLTSVGALALACSSDGVLPDEPLSPLIVCIDPAAQVVVNSSPGRTDFSLSGRVEEVGSGVEDTSAFPGCAFPSDYLLGLPPADSAAGAPSWARVRSSDDPAALSQISVFAPGFSFAGLEGDDVTFEFHEEPQVFAVNPQWLELRRSDGSLLFWLANAESVSGLSGASELQRAVGSVSSQRGDECIPTWEEHWLDVSMDARRASVRPRQRTAVGGMVVTNSMVSVQTSEPSCQDASVTYASAAAWPRELDTDL